MQRLTLFLIAVLVGGCAPDGPLFEANPVSPSAKLTTSRDPFSGLDEEGHKVPRGYWDYVEADETDTWYPPDQGKYPEIWHHPRYECGGDVFDASDSNYNKEHWVNVKVKERDLGHWLNDDDTVGWWKFVPTYLQTVHLHPDHAKTHGDDQDAYVYLHFDEQFINIYNE